LPLAITSTPFWVWCLGFRRWKSLHRLVYPSGCDSLFPTSSS
jgi:DMSO/TMAO reductase YedYZ heme-binding membrane subunit